MELKDLNFEEVFPELKFYIRIPGRENIEITDLEPYSSISVVFRYKGGGIEFPLYLADLFASCKKILLQGG